MTIGWRHQILTCATAFFLCLQSSLQAAAENNSGVYSLTVGDRVSVVLHGQEELWESTVDLDGMLRLSAIGRIKAEGRTLDDAETALEKTISSTGLFVSPRVSMSMVSYAPVTVSGAVRDPGVFSFAATMTVEAAVGLAGGPTLTGTDETGPFLAARQIMGDLTTVETDIQTTAIRLARVEAQLQQRDELKIELSDLVPAGRMDAEFVDYLIARENSILVDVIKSSVELINLRETELAETEKQIALLLERRDVQNNLIGLQDQEKDVIEELRERGLQTRMAMSAFLRAEFGNEARLLEIEAALSQTRARRADIERGLTQFRLDQNLELLELSNKLRAELKILVSRRATLLEKSFLIGDTFGTALAATSKPEISYRVQRRRDGKISTIEIGATERVLPGDIILVGIATDLPAESQDF